MVIFALPILLFSTSVIAQDDFLEASQPSQGYSAGAEASVSEEPALPVDNSNNKQSSFSVLGGYAIDFESEDSPYGVALGVRGGYTLDIGLYLGLKFIYYVGEQTFQNEHNNVVTVNAEVGYDFDFEPIIVRPSLDIGLDTRRELFSIAPGASILVPLDEFIVGLDVRYLSVADADSIQGLSFLASVGVRY